MRLVLTYCYNIYSFQNIPTIQQFFIKFIQRFEFDWRELFELMELAQQQIQHFFHSAHSTPWAGMKKKCIEFVGLCPAGGPPFRLHSTDANSINFILIPLI